MRFSTPSFHQTTLLQTWTPSVPLIMHQPAVLLLQYFPLVEKVCCYHFVWIPQSPQAYPLRCFAFPQPTSGLVSFGVRTLRLIESTVGRETSVAVLSCLCFSPGLCSPVLSNLNRKYFHFLGKDQWWLWLAIFFLFFLPLPNLGYLHCKPDSVECQVHLGAEAHTTEMDVPIETNLIFEYWMSSISSLGNKLRMV